VHKDFHSHLPKPVINPQNSGGLFMEAPSPKGILSAIKKIFQKKKIETRT